MPLTDHHLRQLKKELEKLSLNKSFVKDLKILRESYPNTSINEFDTMREKALQMEDGLIGELQQKCGSMIFKCARNGIRVTIHEAHIQFDDDVKKLCEKWKLYWAPDIVRVQGRKWFADILLDWKDYNDRPQLEKIPNPPISLILPVIESSISSDGHTESHFAAKAVHIIVRSGVTRRNLSDLAEKVYEASQGAHSFIKNTPYERSKGGRPSLPTRDTLRAEFKKRNRSDFTTQSALVEDVWKTINEFSPLSLKTVEAEYVKYKNLSAGSRPPKRKRYITRKHDSR